MSLPDSMPNLFGRCTAILKDHVHLKTSLKELRSLCARLEDGERPPANEQGPEHLLTAFHADLLQHFAAEEAEGYFGTVVEEEPQLEPHIAALKCEHATMLSAVEMLVELARDPGRWVHLPAPLRLVVLQLERHEVAESGLLKKFFFPLK